MQGHARTSLAPCGIGGVRHRTTAGHRCPVGRSPAWAAPPRCRLVTLTVLGDTESIDPGQDRRHPRSVTGTNQTETEVRTSLRRLATADRLGLCDSCEGRGWKFVSCRRVVLVAEDSVQLVRRPCLDCLGATVVRAA